jgi:hypothetical protein
MKYGRRPEYFFQMEHDLNFFQMDDDLNFILGNLIFGMQQCFNPTRWNIEDNINFLENGKNPQYLKWTTTSILF